MDILVGSTGFVGGNIASQYVFDQLYNSKNIGDAYGLCPKLCIYAGVKAEKYIANRNHIVDQNHIKDTINNIKKINPQKLVLISTIDVYNDYKNVDENSEIIQLNSDAYGKNRRYLEKWVEENIAEYHIIRLPALFGDNIKKNFIYDILNPVPYRLNEQAYKMCLGKNRELARFYSNGGEGFYRLTCAEKEKEGLEKILDEIGFSAINFTDSRTEFQFYNLKYLWSHINIALSNNLKHLNLAVEPICAEDIYYRIEKKRFVNLLDSEPQRYDFKTLYAPLFGSNNMNYIFERAQVISEIEQFVITHRG